MSKTLQFCVVVMLGPLCAACGSEDNLQQKASEWRAEASREKAAFLATSDNASSDSQQSSSLTGPQRNAVRTAQSYLDIMGFSRKGLIEQLSSDAGSGYSVADATVAVDSLRVDWNLQAARKAKAYLEIMGFSCKGLIEQLSSRAGDGFTVEQATYGASQAGAC